MCEPPGESLEKIFLGIFGPGMSQKNMEAQSLEVLLMALELQVALVRCLGRLEMSKLKRKTILQIC